MGKPALVGNGGSGLFFCSKKVRLSMPFTIALGRVIADCENLQVVLGVSAKDANAVNVMQGRVVVVAS